MIELKNVTKRFNERTAVDDFSATVGSGEIVGFLGPNGAGKSTTMRMIAGFLSPDEGEILVDGIDVTRDPVDVKKLIGYLPENNPLFTEMLVSEFLDLICGLRGIDVNEQAGAIERAVSLTGIEEVFYRPIQQLSKGFRQRTGLAQAIIHQPDVLILDEPTEGLDPNQRVGIRELIKELGKEHTVLLSTHVLQEVKGTCNRVIIIHQGKMAADGSIGSLLAEHKQKNVIASLGGSGIKEKLEILDGVSSVSVDPAGKPPLYKIAVDPDAELRPVISKLAAENKWELWELYQEEAGLEEVFRFLTADEGES